MTIRHALPLFAVVGLALAGSAAARPADTAPKAEGHAAADKGPEAGKHADSGKHGAAGHGPVKLKAHVHTPDGGKELKFDLGNEADKKQLFDYLEHGHVEELKEDKPPELLSLKWDLGLWSVVVFLVLFYVLAKYAWPQVLEGLQTREANIQGAMDEAERTRAEAQKLQAQLQQQMAQANDQVRGILEEARKDAVRTTEEMIAKARAEIASDRDRLRRELETGKDQALQELWRQSVQLASLMSAKAIKQNLDPAAHQRLFDEAVSELGKSTDAFIKQQS